MMMMISNSTASLSDDSCSLENWELGFQGREKEEEQEKRRKKLLADEGRVCVCVFFR
jgi:hypothetical protein